VAQRSDDGIVYRLKKDPMQPVLHTYFRSSAAYRVRIALNLKGIHARHEFVHLNRDGGQQFSAAFRSKHPQALVPVYSEDGMDLGQSLAILEYLEERYPEPPLLPTEPKARARVRQIALGIACDIHPLNNLRVLKYLGGTLGLNDEQKNAWVRHWIALGLSALEQQLAGSSATGIFCVGNTPTLADCCLVPQWFSAERFGVDVSEFPTLQRIADHCNSLPGFAAAHPARQPDAE
jgi:maleylpyruvate isomerase